MISTAPRDFGLCLVGAALVSGVAVFGVAHGRQILGDRTADIAECFPASDQSASKRDLRLVTDTPLGYFCSVVRSSSLSVAPSGTPISCRHRSTFFDTL